MARALLACASVVVVGGTRVAAQASDPSPTGAAPAPALDPMHSRPVMRTYSDLQVDLPARELPGSPVPSYPIDATAPGGTVVARFTVDTVGHVVLHSITIVRSADPAFTTAVLDILPRLRFTPADKAGRKVNQVVDKPFLFAAPR